MLLRLLLFLGMASPALAADAFIAHPGITSDFTVDGFRDLLIGRRTSWKDGSRVTVVLVKGGSPAVERLAERRTEQLMRTWKRNLFTGQGTLPVTVADEAAVVAFVAKTPGAFSVVDQSAVVDGVTILLIR